MIKYTVDWATSSMGQAATDALGSFGYAVIIAETGGRFLHGWQPEGYEGYNGRVFIDFDKNKYYSMLIILEDNFEFHLTTMTGLISRSSTMPSTE